MSEATQQFADVERKPSILLVRMLDVIAWTLLVALLVARATSPSDLHDQTQPRTIAYTIDLVRHPDRWALPLEHGAHAATKPPLYNWIAAPFVALTDGRSEFAHKIPSVFALFGIGAILWVIGRRIDRDSMIGAVAVIAFATNYLWCKLGYLARPDALLSLWLVIGWMSTTVVVFRDERRRPANFGWRLLIWVSVALAFLTKGPPAILTVLYGAALGAVIAYASSSRAAESHEFVRSIARALHRMGILWGLPLALLIGAGWLYLAYRLNPEHVRVTLFEEEILGHLFGAETDTRSGGMSEWLRTSPNMPFYFLSRFLPWSVFYLVAWLDVFGRPARGVARGLPDTSEAPEERQWIIAGLVYPVLVLLFFTLAVAKRADYIAAALPPAALVVGWWMDRRGLRLGRRAPWLAPLLGLVTLIGLDRADRHYGFAAQFPLADAYWQFAEQTHLVIDADPAPVILYETRRDPLPSMMGFSEPPVGAERIRPAIEDAGGPAWIIAPSHHMPALLERPFMRAWQVEERLLVDAPKGGEPYPPYEIGLYRVEPR